MVSEGIPGIAGASGDVIKQYLDDMERGLNVAVNSRKGRRSYLRLNSSKDKLIFLARQLEHRFSVPAITQAGVTALRGVFLCSGGPPWPPPKHDRPHVRPPRGAAATK